jgi:hypothetical protein
MSRSCRIGRMPRTTVCPSRGARISSGWSRIAGARISLPKRSALGGDGAGNTAVTIRVRSSLRAASFRGEGGAAARGAVGGSMPRERWLR